MLDLMIETALVKLGEEEIVEVSAKQIAQAKAKAKKKLNCPPGYAPHLVKAQGLNFVFKCGKIDKAKSKAMSKLMKKIGKKVAKKALKTKKKWGEI